MQLRPMPNGHATLATRQAFGALALRFVPQDPLYTLQGVMTDHVSLSKVFPGAGKEDSLGPGDIVFVDPNNRMHALAVEDPEIRKLYNQLRNLKPDASGCDSKGAGKVTPQAVADALRKVTQTHGWFWYNKMEQALSEDDDAKNGFMQNIFNVTQINVQPDREHRKFAAMACPPPLKQPEGDQPQQESGEKPAPQQETRWKQGQPPPTGAPKFRMTA